MREWLSRAQGWRSIESLQVRKATKGIQDHSFAEQLGGNLIPHPARKMDASRHLWSYTDVCVQPKGESGTAVLFSCLVGPGQGWYSREQKIALSFVYGAEKGALQTPSIFQRHSISTLRIWFMHSQGSIYPWQCTHSSFHSRPPFLCGTDAIGHDGLYRSKQSLHSNLAR